MKFNYQARSPKGETQVGVIEASSRDAALQLLSQHGLFVTILEESGERPFYAKPLPFLERVKGKDVMLFSRHLAILFKSQVPLLQALRTLALQTKSRVFAEKIMKLSEDVEGGTSFSQALLKNPNVFSSYYVSMVRSGETAGSLSAVLDSLAEHLEREYTLQNKIKSALTYPAFIVTIGLAVLFLMVIFVVPNLTRTLSDLGGELPFITKAVIGLVDVLRSWWWAFLFLLGGGVFLLLRYIKTSEGKKNFDLFLLKVPGLNTFLRMMYLSRFAENLATLVAGGIGIVSALEILGEAKESVQRGAKISDVLGRYPLEFPPVFTQMVLVGEQSGTLDTTLLNIVQFYQRELTNSVESFLSILEPLLIVVLGLLVGGLMAAILLPLYQLVSI
ncbi:MAG: type II secretion system F family protein [Candidatus Wildermuthbacteria bacterium]|nr:type II secretion system F family protein [Candidatus Wildermuthbacteria bacterium]